MTDREMLELAARAAGYVVESHHVSGGAWVYPVGEVPDADGDYHGLFLWRPRDDDGDALRLAVALWIHIAQHLSYCATCCPHGGNSTRGMTWTEQYNGDARAATRLAIFRAAAETGRQMETSNG